MEKNADLKSDPHYSKLHLRQKIEESIKRQRDDTCEIKETPMKMLPVDNGEPNRDSDNKLKHFRYKFL